MALANKRRKTPVALRQKRNKLRRHGLLPKFRTRQPLRLRLVDGQNEPITGATVTVRDRNDKKALPQSGVTDDRGEVTLATGKAVLRGEVSVERNGSPAELDAATRAMLEGRMKAIRSDDAVDAAPQAPTSILRTGDILVLA